MSVTLLGSGGQGDVYELSSDPGQTAQAVPARASPSTRRASSPSSTGASTLPPKDMAIIDKHTAWPLEVVDCEDGTYGILMNRAPQEYWHTVEGDTLPRDLSWAFMVDAARFVGLQPATPLAAVADDGPDRHGLRRLPPQRGRLRRPLGQQRALDGRQLPERPADRLRRRRRRRPAAGASGGADAAVELPLAGRRGTGARRVQARRRVPPPLLPLRGPDLGHARATSRCLRTRRSRGMPPTCSAPGSSR